MSLKTSFVALALLAAAPGAIAAESLLSDFEINGRSFQEISATLATQGITATDVEEVGDAIRVYAQNEDGSSYTVLVDDQTLQPFAQAKGVLTTLDVETAPRVVRPTLPLNESTASLVESSDD